MLSSGLMTPLVVGVSVVVLLLLFTVRSKLDNRKADRLLQEALDDFQLSTAHPSLRGRERTYVYEVVVPYWLMRVMVRLGFAGSVSTIWSAPGHLEDQEDSEDLQDS